VQTYSIAFTLQSIGTAAREFNKTGLQYSYYFFRVLVFLCVLLGIDGNGRVRGNRGNAVKAG
jgi:hypothetical protein